jgi:Protein of unknown function (DUF1501)
MTSTVSGHRHRIGIHRREVLQVGFSGLLGLGMSSWLASSRAAQPSRYPKSVLIVFLTGAPSHLDTFDLKPDAPPEIRGDFKPISTKIPGIVFGEHVPRLAARNDKFALIRTLAHRENNHLVATHHVLTGHPQPGAFFDKVASRDDWPCYSAGLNYFHPRADGMPCGVNLPTFLVEGPLTWPGQHAGILGPRHDPWQISRDPNRADFRVDNLSLAQGLAIDQLSNRLELLDQVNRQQHWLAESAEGRRLTDQQQRALTMLTSGKISRAFEIDREPLAVRDRYGRHSFGQSLLLARRLIQAGVPVVQANMGRVQNWDNHSNIFPTLKNRLLPPLDQGVSALLDDLEASGLLQETMVMLLGEFGRTPKISATGRDHWAPCFFGIFAGAGVRPGQVIGKSDKIGAYPSTTPYSPDDIGATVYHVLGIDPASEVRDRQNRPVTLNRGQVIQPLFG